MPAPERRLLILGGTAEASALARAAVATYGGRLDVVTSLAGRTPAPAPLPGIVRSGGFGGADGLAAFLRQARIDSMVIATHPFAAAIARHARLASTATGIERLVLLRPPWQAQPGDRWIEVPDFETAAAAVPRLGRRALLTIGAKGLAAFATVEGVAFVIRLLAPPRLPIPVPGAEIVTGRLPFTLDEELHLLHRHEIEVVVAKASGGIAAAKLDAARTIGIPVILVARPPPEPGPTVETVGAAMQWIAARMDVTVRNEAGPI